MRTLLNPSRLAALPLALIFFAAIAFVAIAPRTAQAAKAGTQVFEGNVVHVSSNNIKVANPHETLSFVLVPHFDRVFSDDGKTTVQMATLKPGRLVKVYYDQKGLGIRHADRIIVLNRHEEAVKKMKS
jgi:hypothetical protein